jgi:hypothetical protein
VRGGVRALELALRFREDEYEYDFPKGRLWRDALPHLPVCPSCAPGTG